MWRHASIDGPALSSAHLRALATWVSSHRTALRAHCIAYALVRQSIPTPVRFATALMLSIIPITPMPYRMFGDRESALAWVTKLTAGNAAASDLQSKAWSETSHPD